MKKKLTKEQKQDIETAKSAYAKYTEMLFGEVALVIPDNEEDGVIMPYPGNIKPGRYTMNQTVELLRLYKDNPEAIEFLADMLEV